VGVKIMPTGVNCDRLLAGLQWRDTIWRRGELKVLSIQIVAQLESTIVVVAALRLPCFNSADTHTQPVSAIHSFRM